MKVLVLVHESLVPPSKPKNKEEIERADWKTEFDVVSHLKKLNHKVDVLGLGSDLKVLRDKIDTFKPKVVFNLLEEFAGEALLDQNVVSFLELLKVKYTGCNPRGLILSRDKALCKKILKYHRIPTPHFMVFKKTKNYKKKKYNIPSHLKFPLFVKTLNEEASLGITQGSIVKNEEQLTERVLYFFEKFNTDVIVESFIEGREFYVGVMGNKRIKVLPVWELFFSKVSDRVPKVATSKVKWDFNYRKKYGIKTGLAKNISAELESRIRKICSRTYKVLELNGYARIDLRVDIEGQIYVIEVNPNPDIGCNEDLSSSAEYAGMNYEKLLSLIIKYGRSWDGI